eukprot:CAMPEP_0115472252 /NCGR_PEP_ID=MMETSP0271-20121206/52948_1 /TAXON_ID=71861 /ORGANISM="Scrippsiella trochoidea, Strain CCMP3099" /LENGTH=34 /DNA_ID= /DNA_START= /DNA_END= /DNA_ORIENTATION=
MAPSEMVLEILIISATMSCADCLALESWLAKMSG